MDDYGDGLDGGVYTVDYTFGANIATIGTGLFSIPVVHCGGLYLNNEIEDSTSWTTAYVAAPACLFPTALLADTITDSSAYLHWTENNSATSWRVEIGLAGFAHGQGLLDTIVTTNPFFASGGNSSTTYDWYVKSICSAADTSAWSPKNTFTTLISAPAGINCTGNTPTLVFSDEFNAQGGWTGDWGTANRVWRINSGPTTSTSTGPAAAHSGANYAYFESSVSGTDTTGNIVSPPIHLVTGSGDAELSFWMHAYGSSIGTLNVGVSSSPTGQFTTLFSTTGQIQSINLDPWTEVGVDLSAYSGQTIYIGFFYTHPSVSGFNGDLAIDKMEVNACMNAPDPVYAIGTINTVDTLGSPDSLGVECWASGIVSGVDLDGNAGISFTMLNVVNGAQEGINIFNFIDVNDYVVNEGDSIDVHGEIDFYNGLLELKVNSIVVASTGNALPAHRLVTTLDESTESNMIEMRGLTVTAASSATSSSVNYTLSDGTNTFTMRVDGDTDVHDSTRFVVGDTICHIKGIGGQFDSSSPYLSGYQIFPMRFSDIDTCTSVGIADQNIESDWSIFPNPSNGEFTFSSTGLESNTTNVKITDISGRTIRTITINNTASNFSKVIDLNNQSKGLYFMIIENGDKQIIEKLILR